MCVKVSVIIPVYNCENYIDKCIKSILFQSYKNIEIIIVNDGSLDNTEEIIKKYILFDKRIKYFTQENLGPSIARNKGIENASGEYLVFVDSDDSINKLYLEKLLNKIKSDNYDIACCGYIDESKYGVVSLNDFWKNKDSLDKQEFLDCLFNGVGGVLWGKILRRDIIVQNKIRMNPKIFMSEDLIFILEYCKYSNKFGVINENLYYYNRLNKNSISSNIDISYLENYILLVNEIKAKLKVLKVNNKKIENIIISKIQSLLNRVLESESRKYLITKDKNKFIRNLSFVIENTFIQGYKSKFITNSFLDKSICFFIKRNKYSYLLYLNIIIINLRDFKDKILRIRF